MSKFKRFNVLSHLTKTSTDITELRPHNVPEYIPKREPPHPHKQPVDKSDFRNYLLQDKTKVWRLNIYRRMFTPYEQEKKFSDESYFEYGDECSFVCITDAFTLPDGDLMLAVRNVYDSESLNESEEKWQLEYYKLSEIRLSYYPTDKEIHIESW